MDNRQQKTSVIAIISIIAILSSILIVAVNGLKPEIQHKFREPEKRPPVIVTTFFTALVACPALLLFTLWSRTVSLKFEALTIRRIMFHIIFLMALVCYAKFWLGTNMFDTMKYTAPLICALFYVFK